MYSVNEKIVYPGHGVTVVTQIINKTIINETLQKKYGDGSINLEKGEFISA